MWGISDYILERRIPRKIQRDEQIEKLCELCLAQRMTVHCGWRGARLFLLQ